MEKILATHQFYIQDSLSVPYDTNIRRYIINVNLVPVCLKQKQQYSYFTMSCFYFTISMSQMHFFKQSC